MPSRLATAIVLALGAGPFVTAVRAATTADDEASILQFTAHPIDTRVGVTQVPAGFLSSPSAGPGLQLVQFAGPVRQAWLDELKAQGVTPLQYVPSNGYLVWADETAQARLAGLRGSTSWLRYAAPFLGFQKLAPELAARLSGVAAGMDEVDITVQIHTHPGATATRQFIAAAALLSPLQQGPLGGGADLQWAPVLRFENLDLRVRLSDIAAIAERTDVTFVGLRAPRVLMDEKQGLLLAGDPQPGPASPSYLQFLLDRGFSRDPAAYPIVDVTDSTIDEGGTGVTVLNTVDRFLRVDGDPTRPARVNHFTNCSSRPDATVGAYDGHGSLNAGIVAGYDQSTGYPYQDADGQRLGLGINPFARVGSTTIFSGNPQTYDVSRCGGSDQGVILRNWRSGARISSNSWGANPVPTVYDASDQAYDAGVRDADPGTPGNQEMIYVFAASNAGPGAATVSSPGAGKNVITVGASENLRPFATPPGNICSNDPANNPQNIAPFSGRGPAPGQRAKPELVAPGTHVQAAAPVFAGYTGGGVCVQYYPQNPSQTLFTYSSGTSHSTPAVSGVASLAYWWIEHGGAGAAAGSIDQIGGARAPSPALMKAWLMAHPTYLTGVSANDTLPGRGQGYGMPDMSAMFDATPKFIVDQSEVFDESGASREYRLRVADPSRPVRITLAYTDAPGMLGASPQVNDLNLVVEAAGQTWLGNRFDGQWSVPGGNPDSRNNYEAVFLPAGPQGEFSVSVVAANIAGDAVPHHGDETDQDFALVCSNCERVPTFTLESPQDAPLLCAGSTVPIAFTVGQVNGYAEPVTLRASGQPAGIVTTFSPNPAMPPATAILSLQAGTAAAAGRYPLWIEAVSGTTTRTLDLDLSVFDRAPTATTTTSPADGASELTTTPTLSWTAVAAAHHYRVEIATDIAFTQVVSSHETRLTQWTLEATEALDPGSRYFWRVIAVNPCGSAPAVPSDDTVFVDGFEVSASTVKSFSTRAAPGECAWNETPAIVFEDTLESGAPGWTHGAAAGSTDLWTLGGAAHTGTRAWQASPPAIGTANDTWLATPAITLPSGFDRLSLSFWNRQQLKTVTSGGCYDGGLLELSTNGGSTWTAVADRFLSNPYDGALTSSFGNPLGGRDAWCGDPRPYTKTVIDLGDHAGQTVRVRFRLGQDRLQHRADPNWAIDDVRVTGCIANPP